MSTIPPVSLSGTQGSFDSIKNKDDQITEEALTKWCVAQGYSEQFAKTLFALINGGTTGTITSGEWDDFIKKTKEFDGNYSSVSLDDLFEAVLSSIKFDDVNTLSEFKAMFKGFGSAEALESLFRRFAGDDNSIAEVELDAMKKALKVGDRNKSENGIIYDALALALRQATGDVDDFGRYEAILVEAFRIEGGIDALLEQLGVAGNSIAVVMSVNTKVQMAVTQLTQLSSMNNQLLQTTQRIASGQ